MRWLSAKPAALLLAWSVSAGACLGFTVTNSQNLSSSAANRLYGAGESILPGGSGTWADPWVYHWTNVTAGLFGTNWAISTTGQEDSFVLDLNTGDILGPELTLSTETTPQGFPRGGVTIRSAGTVVLKKITTRTYSSSYGYYGSDRSGDIQIGETNNPVGPVTVGDLWTDCSPPVCNPWAGSVTIFGAGDVRIRRSDGSPGKICTTLNAPSPNVHPAGSITIRHDGNFSCGSVVAVGLGDNMVQGGTVRCDGDLLTNGPSGKFQADVIETYQDYGGQWDGYRGGPVTITNYTGVQVSGRLYTYSNGTVNHPAGNVAIRGIRGDIEITADLDLHAKTPGVLDLSTGGAGKITLGSSTNWGDRTLDLGKMGYVLFDGPQKGCVIYQAITNFAAGTPNTQIRVQKDGYYVLYAYKRDGVNYNIYTNAPGGIYSIKSESGGVGYLKPLYSKGTIVSFR